ncbi:hypothetical protein [Paenibacillus sp. YN15]|uniref:hypothetical protein n=1 Tax=Paenibacillus sp. YN15 TaxID=1742774 RepID=UPI000DCE98A9|nr:hypothetical protein [Paenibacillus sp. YN15]RAV06332.1 hypothetical protein DQG13_00335 [Paenibacillus sp. YN15]
MNAFIYLLLGTVDIFLVITLIFKVFRWPLRQYARETLIIAFLCSAESYLARIVFEVPEVDLILQNLIILVMMKALLKVNFYYGLTLSVIGSFLYSEIAYLTYNLFGLLNIPLDLSTPTSAGIYFMQISVQLAAVLASFLLGKFNLGFSFVAVPPHDGKRRFTPKEKINLIISSLAVVCIFVTVHVAINYGTFGINAIMVLELCALLILMYIARKQDAI